MDDWMDLDDGFRCLADLACIVPLDEIADNAELTRLDERAEVYATLQEAGMLRFRLRTA